jgi:hypothetical protein
MIKKYKGRLILLSIELLLFVILYIVTRLWLSEVYLFEWAGRRLFLFVWVLTAMLVLAGRKIASVILTASSIAGLFFWQFVGDAMRNYNISTITADMDAGLQAELRSHKGAYYWMMTLVAAVVIGVALEIIIAKIKNKKKKAQLR